LENSFMTTKKMLIDASHPEETRVVVVNGSRVEEFDYESAGLKPLKGNIYLAKVTRVEPSLQAAFIDYGGNRHGFLAFSEIHPDYYKIPVADREALIAEENEAQQSYDAARAAEGDEELEPGGRDVAEEMEQRRAQAQLRRRYKIQEVIKRRQILLVQVTKEERGNKGAALTTYLSLAGRYCVLMPNTGRGGGISRKISDAKDRRRLKSVIADLSVPTGTSLILRTAGAERTKAEIKRDYEYLVRLWDDIRENTLRSTAPALIHEEGNLIKRSIRDLYSRDIEAVLVDGEEGYKTAKAVMKMMIPSHARRVQHYKDSEQNTPLFQRYSVESHLDDIHKPVVQLKSGGYIVINPTEALVAIDVNSGRATKGRHIEETALKTNLEASDEVARQLRLRDLAGLIVIDYIDMDESRHNGQVERRLKEAVRQDRARIQIGRISNFGLLEMSRQRLRSSLVEASTETCPICAGVGLLRTVESVALHALRAVEEEALKQRDGLLTMTLPTAVALYVLNQKRYALHDLEARYGTRIRVEGDDSLNRDEMRLERSLDTGGAPLPVAAPEPARAAPEPRAAEESDTDEDGDNEGERSSGRRRGGRRRRRPGEDEARGERRARAEPAQEAEETESDSEDGGDEAHAAHDGQGTEEGRERSSRRRRGRRGGRRRGRRRDEEHDGSETVAADAVHARTGAEESPEPGDVSDEDSDAAAMNEPAEVEEATSEGVTSEEGDTEEQEAENAGTTAEEEAAAAKPKRRRPSRRKAKPKESEAPAEAEAEAEAETDTPETAVEDEVEDRGDEAVAEEPVEVEDSAHSNGGVKPGPVEEDRPLAASSGTEPDSPVEETRTETPAAERPARRGWWERAS
jgi:ribonuclease E